MEFSNARNADPLLPHPVQTLAVAEPTTKTNPSKCNFRSSGPTPAEGNVVFCFAPGEIRVRGELLLIVSDGLLLVASNLQFYFLSLHFSWQ